MANKTLIVIVGPTAVGKTDLCISLAKELDTEIISADSRQFYQEMNIGTAKPTKEEMQSIKHHFVGHISVYDEMNPGLFEREGLAVLEELFKKKDVVILSGGSGMYIKALCEGIDEMPPIAASIREKLNQELRENGLNELQKRLLELDPDYYEVVDLQNPQRLIRALEVCISSGKAYSSFRKSTKKERPFQLIKLGLSRERDELYQRIDDRMEVMLANGLLEEAKKLYPLRQLNALQTVGYSEIFNYLDGQYDWDECVRLLKRNSRRYAKRQLTWFRKDNEITWFHPDQIKEIMIFINYQIAK